MADVQANQPPAANAANATARQGPKEKGAPRAPVFLNPENPPDLIAKFRKEIGKTIRDITVTYTATATQVTVQLLAPLLAGDEQIGHPVSATEYNLRLKAHKQRAEPSASAILDEEYEFVSLYEKRLNKAFPTEDRPVDFSSTGRKRWILTQPFEDRKILMMNSKQFRKHQRDQEGSDDD